MTGKTEKTPLRHILTLAVSVSALGGFFILNCAVKAPEILESERRAAAEFPKLTAGTLLSGEFMRGFEDFAADSFAFRDAFRTIKAFSVFEIFRQTDKSGLYRDDLVGAGKFAAPTETDMRRTARKLKSVADSLGGLNVYVSVIPDKSAFAGRKYPGFDMKLAESIIAEELPDARYIDLVPELGADSFYKTDLHWDQSKIAGVADKIAAAAGGAPPPDGDAVPPLFQTRPAGAFCGVYRGQLALPMPPDTMIYMTPSPGTVTRYLDDKTLSWEEGEMYDLEAFAGRDPYDIFLRGARALIAIENPDAGEGARELYLFRDSFASSLAPLLIPYYSKITLIDLRYIDFRVLPSLVEFSPGADALFLYSSQILGSPDILNAG
ncbi:MAG: hypothetical protein LBD49_05805 [Oscillospiraceae bacterium]|jgi:hypothetical protein|nr:hypothetical protein [Oscillospiraceae bacterium]